MRPASAGRIFYRHDKLQITNEWYGLSLIIEMVPSRNTIALLTDAQRPGGGLGGGGAPRSESEIPMIAGGNHTIMYGLKSRKWCGNLLCSRKDFRSVPPPSRLLLGTFLADQEKYPSGGCNVTISSVVAKNRNCPTAGPSWRPVPTVSSAAPGSTRCKMPGPTQTRGSTASRTEGRSAPENFPAFPGNPTPGNPGLPAVPPPAPPW